MNGSANTVNAKIMFVVTYLNCYSVDKPDDWSDKWILASQATDNELLPIVWLLQRTPCVRRMDQHQLLSDDSSCQICRRPSKHTRCILELLWNSSFWFHFCGVLNQVYCCRNNNIIVKLNEIAAESFKKRFHLTSSSQTSFCWLLTLLQINNTWTKRLGRMMKGGGHQIKFLHRSLVKCVPIYYSPSQLFTY